MNALSLSQRAKYFTFRTMAQVAARITMRSALLILAGTAVATGLALNWSALVAAGIAPMLLAILPCLAMCAVGLCMGHARPRPRKASLQDSTQSRDRASVSPDIGPSEP